MANTNTLVTNFNTSPYYDDFDESKNYHRILFNPSLAVQARELTQMQTILQKQIDRHAEHIFAEGSLVRDGKINIDRNYRYVKINDLDALGNPVNVSELLGKRLTANNGITALIVHVEEGAEADSPDLKTLYLKYRSSSTDGTQKFFLSSSELDANTGVSVVVNSATDAVGIGAAMRINEGIVYAKDHFIRFDADTVMLSKYTNKPSARVGFLIDENIVTNDEDYTLLDPAQGSYNYAAPGADRLQLIPRIVVLDIEDDIPDDFIQLLDIRDGVINQIANKPTYSVIRDEFARRTYDESGDYTVKGLNVRIREHLNDGSNGGLFTSAQGGNSSLLAVGVEAGKAYIKGYEIEKLVTDYIDVPKGIDYDVLEEQTISTNYGNYIQVNEFVGNWDVNDAPVIQIYNQHQQKITSKDGSSAPSGSQIGTAILRSVELESGVPGSNSAIYRVYVTDVKMTGGAFSTAKSLYINNSSTADSVADIKTAVLQEKNFDFSIFKIPTSNIRTIRDASGNVETTYPFRKSFDVSIASTGNFTLTSGNSFEIFPYSAGALNTTQKRENFIVSLNASATVSMSGTISASGTTITGSGTQFTRLNVGDKIKITSTNDIRRIVSIGGDVNMVIDEAPSGAVSGSAYVKQYLPGDVLDFGGKGAAAGAIRSITSTSSTSIDFSMEETLSGTVSATVVTNLRRTAATEIKKVMRKNRLVQINLSTHANALTGPWNLGFSDVIKINSVRRHTSAFASTTNGTDVTQHFTLDNGQRDNFYDSALLKKKSTITLSSGQYLLINLDYYHHDTSQGLGFYSVDSYPIDDVNGAANTDAIMTAEIPTYRSNQTGETYNLRDCIDIRMAKIRVANDSTTIGSMTTNPASTNEFVQPSGGLRIAVPNEEIVFDYSHYLPRTDLITIDKSGTVSSIKGTPSLVSAIPPYPAEEMVHGILYVAPYPSLPSELSIRFKKPEYATKFSNVSIRRYTMGDISRLEKRIENLEYYVTLSMLEKSTLDTKVVDENGLDRFKNGIFVDPFNDHGAGDLNNPDYSVAVDRKKSEIRPKFTINNTGFVVDSLTSNLISTKDQITKTYVEALYCDQPYAVTTRNAAGAFYNYIGDMLLTPNNDYWVDTTRLPSIQITNDNNLDNWEALADAWSTEWGAWETVVTGTSTNSRGTTTNTTSTREREVATVTTTTTRQSYGDKVVDVSVIPFIRAQKINFFSSGLKPNTKMYAFFDGENVTTYCRKTTSDYSSVTSATLLTDDRGRIWGRFNIPNNDTLKFRTGSLVFRLTDSPNNETDMGLLTCSSETKFTASGLNQKKQETIVSTIEPDFSVSTVTQTTNSSTFDPAPTPRPTRGRVGSGLGNRRDTDGNGNTSDPIAQTFKIDARGSDGLFLTSIDLYFATKHATHGASVEIREVNSAGYVTNKMLPFSKVIIEPEDINVSSNSSAKTNIVFPSPVFCLDNTSYAFVIKPVANNDATTVYVSKLGRTDLLTGKKITKQPFAGQLFISANDGTYEPVQDEDVKFKLYTATFNTSSGTLVFKNSPADFISSSIFTGRLDVAEEVFGESRLTLSTITGGTILPTDILTGATSGAIGDVTNIAGAVHRTLVTNGILFSNGETVNVSDSGGTPKGVTAVVSSQYAPRGILSISNYIDSENLELDINRTNSNVFVIGETVRGEDSGETAVIDSFREKVFNLFNPQSSELNFFGTQTIWSYKAMNSIGSLNASWISMDLENDVDLKAERELRSFSVTPISLQFRCVMNNTDSKVTPVVNHKRTHTTLIKNIINNDATGENGKSGGEALVKYISRKVTLAEGQDAEDIKVYLTGYRPSGSDIRVYGKFLNASDSDSFDDVDWVELTMSSKSLYSDISQIDDFKEFEYSIPASSLTGPNEEFQYVNSNAVTFTGYKYFSLKIVLLSSLTYRIPRCADVRAICLQK